MSFSMGILRRPCFSGDNGSGNTGSPSCPARFHNSPAHSFADKLPRPVRYANIVMFYRNGIGCVCPLVIDCLHNMGLIIMSFVAEHRGVVCHLERCYSNLALSDSQADQIPLRPFSFSVYTVVVLR